MPRARTVDCYVKCYTSPASLTEVPLFFLHQCGLAPALVEEKQARGGSVL